MTSQTDHDITLILKDLGTDGHDTAVAKLLPLVYDELRSLSAQYLNNERPDHTLQATALVHEAYIRLAGSDGSQWSGRAHFFRVAAKTMRRILINHAKAHKAMKRGGGDRGIMLHETHAIAAAGDVDLIALDESLQRLNELDSEKAKVVELRFFGGCTIEESAEALNISTRTVERHWQFARAWLKAELAE